VKQLKDANKALSLYASKIIDRIISQEGFEHVLAVDYGDTDGKPVKPKPKVEPKPRPVSLLARAASLSISSPAPPSPSTATPRPPLRISTVAAESAPAGGGAGGPEPTTPMGKRERRGLSMDWSKLNPFARGGGEPQTPVVDPRVAGLKPLNLRADGAKPPASPIIMGGRKLDNHEDEDDRIERERLNAQMKLMGLEREQSVHTPGVTTFAGVFGGSSGGSGPDTPGSRSSVGWGRRPGSIRQDSSNSGTRIPTEELRAEHLELEDESHMLAAAAETRIAALDMREKTLSAEMAKGRGGGFTEPPARGTRVRRRTNSQGSGASTLFSAGRLSRGGSEAEIGEDIEGEIQ
jgi:hypothetical protein